MIHLISLDTEAQVNDLQLRFEASRIPIFVQSDFSRTDPASRNTFYGHRFYIWIEEQLEDAKRLIDNPNYQVEKPVDVQEFYALLNDQDKNSEVAYYVTEEKWLNIIFGMAAIGLVGWIIYALTNR